MISVEFGYIREKLDFLKEKYDVVIFGSFVNGEMRPKSDIDIAVKKIYLEKLL